MTYNDIFTCRNLLLNVPLHCEGRSLCGKTTASVLLLRVAYGRKADEFIGTMQGVRAELEREGKKNDEEALRQAQDKHAAEDAVETLFVHIVLILSYTYRLGVYLYKFGKGLLQSAGDGNCRAQS